MPALQLVGPVVPAVKLVVPSGCAQCQGFQRSRKSEKRTEFGVFAENILKTYRFSEYFDPGCSQSCSVNRIIKYLTTSSERASDECFSRALAGGGGCSEGTGEVVDGGRTGHRVVDSF